MSIFAYTEPSGNYPGYVSINENEHGVAVTVRSSQPDRFRPGDQATLTIPISTPEATALKTLAHQPSPRADDALRSVSESAVDRAIEAYAGGLVVEDDTANPRGFTTRYKPRAAMRSALTAALASEEPTGPVCTLCELRLAKGY